MKATAHMLNPLVEANRNDTLFAVDCALAFIERVHTDIADWSSLAAGDASICGPSEMTSAEHYGLAMLIGCVRGAVKYEIEGHGNDEEEEA